LSKKMIVAVIVAAIVVAGVVIGIQRANTSSSSSGSSSTYAKAFLADKPVVDRLIAGIPQNGSVLGKPKAPVSIVEYMDYKCPICGLASHNVTPAVITDYVKTGRATMELRPVHVISGNQSVTAALDGLAAAPQGRMWEFTELIMRNQGSETAPWLTDAVLTDAATTVGVNTTTWNATANGQGVVAQFFTIQSQWSQDTQAAGKGLATPTFVVHGPKGTVLFQGDVTLATFTQAITTVSGG
jgi:protein-disulfide isomerase